MYAISMPAVFRQINNSLVGKCVGECRTLQKSVTLTSKNVISSCEKQMDTYAHVIHNSHMYHSHHIPTVHA